MNDFEIANVAGGAAFEVVQADSMFVPYGEYRHAAGLQVFGRAEAEAMAANIAGGGVLGTLRRWVGGVPVYIGHPDVPGQRQDWPDKRAYAWVTGANVEEGGLRLSLKYSRAGRELIEDGAFRFYSPYWAGPRGADGSIHPQTLLSVGLTNQPNIPVPALANEQAAEDELDTERGGPEGGAAKTNHEKQPGKETNNNQEKKQPMNKELTDALGLSEDAAIEEIVEAVRALAARAEEAEGKLAEAEGAKAQAEGEKTEAEKTAANEKTRADALANELAAARAARVDAALDAAVAAGRLPKADRDAKRTAVLALANEAEIGTALAALAAAKPALKTTSETGDLGAAKADVLAANEASTRRANRQAKVREIMARDGATYDAAFARARREAPELFEAAAA